MVADTPFTCGLPCFKSAIAPLIRPGSAAIQQSFLIFERKIAIETVQIVLETGDVQFVGDVGRKSSRQYIGPLGLGGVI